MTASVDRRRRAFGGGVIANMGPTDDEIRQWIRDECDEGYTCGDWMTLRDRLMMVERLLSERDAARVVAAEVEAERDVALRQLAALRWQIEHRGCEASNLGETTHSCRHDAICGLCRARLELDEACRERDALAQSDAVIAERERRKGT